MKKEHYSFDFLTLVKQGLYLSCLVQVQNMGFTFVFQEPTKISFKDLNGNKPFFL